MTILSVNINKIATLRNARGENYPNLLNTALDIVKFGAQGITIHPRPDERHIRYRDAIDLNKNISCELNIEGNPIKKFIDLVNEVKPAQVTLVPDSEDAITSNSGWDTITNFTFLKDIVDNFKSNSIRVSIFIDPDIKMLEGAKKMNADRIELFTGPYAKGFPNDRNIAIEQYVKCAEVATDLDIEINAGHDLNQNNLKFFCESVNNIKEVSIGHALVTESLYNGLEPTIKSYLEILK
ncbi:MAG: pyridoxine 5'-phosphate synthase [Flavobacteriaceae bacterium]|nr:pyridoxine 5'-phosphate synthase [Flavobacteriaceae bacterium]|tara:strand:+ start:12532 stop:13245 length:714 start_codon:yes stop_codon:yes gene_type:complete